jgi:hypothetical protein
MQGETVGEHAFHRLVQGTEVPRPRSERDGKLAVSPCAQCDVYGFTTSLTVRHRDIVDACNGFAVPNPELPESDSDVAAGVTVEIRLRAVTEVNDGAPVGEVVERYGVTHQTVTGW